MIFVFRLWLVKVVGVFLFPLTFISIKYLLASAKSGTFAPH